MISDKQSAALDAKSRHFTAEARAEFVRGLYRGYLDRNPEFQEVAYHADRLARGDTEMQVAATFAESEEARIVTAQRSAHAGSVGNSAPTERNLAPLTIRADDVRRVIADALTRTGQEPSFSDVELKFDNFQRGTDLATIVKDTALAPPQREKREVVEQIIRLLYAGTLHRVASVEEVKLWYNHYDQEGRLPNLIKSIVDSEEARRFTKPEVSPGLLVQLAYEIIFDRGATAPEIDLWRQRLEQGTHTFTGTLFQFFFHQMNMFMRPLSDPVRNNPGQAYLFGSRGHVDAKDWDVLPDPNRRQVQLDLLSHGSMFAMKRSEECVVSILTSLYKGGEYIRSFLENITSQTIFRDHCELIIVDACSPEDEGKVIAEFQRNFPNIVYHRCDTRVGIYEAWNIAAKQARGRYYTNANLDDCRRADSLEIQAATLDSLSFVDVAYQDVLYSFEAKIPFKEVETHDLRTALPVISRYNLMEFNSPHNAPMWRKSLHEDVGYFDEMLKSAGDYDFWMRCLIQGKTFYKSNDAHVGYYVNPDGLSTRTDTSGLEESWAISRAHYRKIISPLLTAPHDEFIGMVEQVGDVPVKNVSTGRRYDIIQAALHKLGSESQNCNTRKRT